MKAPRSLPPLLQLTSPGITWGDQVSSSGLREIHRHCYRVFTGVDTSGQESWGSQETQSGATLGGGLVAGGIIKSALGDKTWERS